MVLHKLDMLWRLCLVRLLRKSRVVRNWELWTYMGEMHLKRESVLGRSEYKFAVHRKFAAKLSRQNWDDCRSVWKEVYRKHAVRKQDPGYQAKCRRLLRRSGFQLEEYWMLPLAWQTFANFELWDEQIIDPWPAYFSWLLAEPSRQD